MLDKIFDPAAVESSLYQEWEKSGVFRADPASAKKPYVIMMPPPNVTGSLHIGHALNHTLQDILIRYHRMRGYDALWLPGKDHASIAVHMLLEQQLAKEGKSRHDLGREKFLERAWKWKEESGGTITRQLRRLGTTPDWPRERFTMDDGLNRAVTHSFVDLYKKGLIYRAKRLVNWDPERQSGISDAELEQRTVQGNLWHLRYPLEDNPEQHIIVATTRPETMLGDVAVAVNPKDDRYKALIGRHVVLPLTGRKIPIIADDYADPETGSGAVKITPAHDFNDFEVGKRHGLPLIDVMDNRAHLNDSVPEAYRGLERFAARKKIIADIEALGLLEKIEPHTHTVPHGDRSGVPVEPRLSDQWWCDAPTLAKPAIEAVESGRTAFIPKQWENTYFEWMRNIQPWCISRQLWWGHQIPAWYGPDGHVFVAESEDAAKADAQKHYGKATALTRDPDVLDTWFSAGLWPFSTLGWPDKTPELKKYYPGNVLVTGFDIIFFWVARMMMMGLHFMGEVPFRHVHLHGLVRDEKGQKMSKTKGNVIDPLDMIDKYGADAVRLTLTAQAAQGRDIRMSESRIEGYRNFGTKLWNAARFCQMNGCVVVAGFDATKVKETVNRWIVGAVAEAAEKAAAAIEAYRFNDGANTMYQFAWGTFCDWYLEFTKPILNGSNEAAKVETRATTAWVLDQILLLLSPFMPFITEDLYAKLSADRPGRLISAAWPAYPAADKAASEEMDWVVRLISAIRSVRAEIRVPAAAQLPLLVINAGKESQKLLATHRDLIIRLARLESVALDTATPPSGSVQILHDEATLVLPLAGVVDLAKERERLNKEIQQLQSEITKVDQKLANQNFVAKAPEEVIAEHRDRRTQAEEGIAALKNALGRLN